MKLAFSTLPCLNAQPIELINYCKKFNFRGIELRADKEDKVFCTDDLQSLSKIGVMFNENDIEILCVGTGVCIYKYDEQQIKKAKKLIDTAYALKSGGIRVFLGNFFKRKDDIKEICDENGIVKALKELCNYNKNVNILMETHNEYSSGKSLKTLIEKARRHNLKCIWDIMHPIECNEGIEQTHEYIKGKIAHIHIKDGKKQADEMLCDYEYTAIGKGELPIENIMKLFMRNGDDMFFSLEWENIWREELKKYPQDVDWIFSHYVEKMKKYNKKVNEV